MGMPTEVGEHRLLNMDMRWKASCIRTNGRDEHSPQLRECLRGHELLTGHVENGVCRGLLFYKPDGLTGRYDDQFDVAALRLSFTSFITGKRPYAPVPITSRWHFQGIFSSTDRSVCPNSSRNLLEGAYLRLRISPRSITTSWSYVLPPIRRGHRRKICRSAYAPPRAAVFRRSSSR